jgi:nucleoside-diphosphate-sugar epimerase
MYNIGITGGSGYIGFSIAKGLTKSFNVKLLDIKEPKSPLPKGVTYQYCDVSKFDELKKCLSDVDLVIHTSIIQIPAITEFKKLAYEVNLLGTQNVCKAVEEVSRVKGLILSGSWHTIGERELKGVIDEAFGFRPDKVEARARLYALSKMAQEATVRFFDEMTNKIYGIIRMGTVLGEGMPEKTAANIFIENGLLGKPLTPFKQSMYRPMLYVDINDICKAYEIFAKKIMNNEIKKDADSMADIFNVYYPEAITIYQLANFTRDEIIKQSKGKIKPEVKIIDNGEPSLFNENDKKLIQVDTSKAINFLGVKKLKSPEESIKNIISERIKKSNL